MAGIPNSTSDFMAQLNIPQVQPLSEDELELVKAAEKGDFLNVDFLMRRGARADKPRPDGWTAAGRAAWTGRSGVLQIMIDHGVDANLSANHTSLLHVAAERGKMVVVKKLLVNHANPSVKDAMARTPFMLAKDEAVRDLLAEAMMVGGYKPAEGTPAYETDEQVLVLTKDAHNADGWFPAVVRSYSPNAIRVHFPMWSSRFDVTARPESLCKVTRENLAKCRTHLGAPDEVATNQTSSKQRLNYIGIPRASPPPEKLGPGKEINQEDGTSPGGPSTAAGKRSRRGGNNSRGGSSTDLNNSISSGDLSSAAAAAATAGLAHVSGMGGGVGIVGGGGMGLDIDYGDGEYTPPPEVKKGRGRPAGRGQKRKTDMSRDSSGTGGSGSSLATASVDQLLDQLHKRFAADQKELRRLNSLSSQMTDEMAAKNSKVDRLEQELRQARRELQQGGGMGGREMQELHRELQEWKNKANHFEGVNSVLHRTMLEHQDEVQRARKDASEARAAANPNMVSLANSYLSTADTTFASLQPNHMGLSSVMSGIPGLSGPNHHQSMMDGGPPPGHHSGHHLSNGIDHH